MRKKDTQISLLETYEGLYHLTAKAEPRSKRTFIKQLQKAVIPMKRTRARSHNFERTSDGHPICPKGLPMRYDGVCGGKHRSKRLKFVCPQTYWPKGSTTRRCLCDTPCSPAVTGCTTYVYPDEDYRLYPGLARGTERWDRIYRQRTTIERSIGYFKNRLGLSKNCSYNSATAKADLFFTAITQHIVLLAAAAMQKLHLSKSLRKLMQAKAV